MNGPRGGPAMAIGMLLLIAAGGCGDGSGRGTSGSAAEGTFGTPVTHDEASTEEALISGILDGTPECLWLRIKENRHALVLPSGTSTRQDGDDVVLVDGDGQEIARSGDQVMVTGGYREDELSCAGAEATGRTIVAGVVKTSGD